MKYGLWLSTKLIGLLLFLSSEVVAQSISESSTLFISLDSLSALEHYQRIQQLNGHSGKLSSRNKKTHRLLIIRAMARIL